VAACGDDGPVPQTAQRIRLRAVALAAQTVASRGNHNADTTDCGIASELGSRRHRHRCCTPLRERRWRMWRGPRARNGAPPKSRERLLQPKASFALGDELNVRGGFEAFFDFARLDGQLQRALDVA
jgi:hypothetical protein